MQVRCNPAYYDIPRQVLQSEEALDRWVKEKLLLATIQELAKHGMVGGQLADETAACAQTHSGPVMVRQACRSIDTPGAGVLRGFQVPPL